MSRRSIARLLLATGLVGAACGRSTQGDGDAGAGGNAGSAAAGGGAGRGGGTTGGLSGGGSGGGSTGGKPGPGGAGGEGAGGTGAMSGNSGAAEPEGGAGGASAGVGATGGQATAGEGAGGIAGSSAGAGATGGAMAGSSASLGPEGCVLYSKGCGSGTVGFECPPDYYYAPPDGCSDCDDPSMPNHNCPIDGAPDGRCTICCCVPTRGGCEKRSGTCVGYPDTPNPYMCTGAYDPPPGCVLIVARDGIDNLCCP